MSSESLWPKLRFTLFLSILGGGVTETVCRCFPLDCGYVSENQLPSHALLIFVFFFLNQGLRGHTYKRINRSRRQIFSMNAAAPLQSLPFLDSKAAGKSACLSGKSNFRTATGQKAFFEIIASPLVHL